MRVTDKDVGYVAELANLELTPEERMRMLTDLNSILGHIERLNEVNTENVAAMAQVSDARAGEMENRSTESYREDVLEGLRKSLPREVSLANAPETDGTFFEVPKVIER